MFYTVQIDQFYSSQKVSKTQEQILELELIMCCTVFNIQYNQ